MWSFKFTSFSKSSFKLLSSLELLQMWGLQSYRLSFLPTSLSGCQLTTVMVKFEGNSQNVFLTQSWDPAWVNATAQKVCELAIFQPC